MKNGKLDKKGITGAAAAIIIVALLVIAGVAVGGFMTNWTFKYTAPTDHTGQTTPVGTYNIQGTVSDALAMATSRTMGTDITILYYAKSASGGWIQLGNAGAVQTTPVAIVMDVAYGGYIYCVLSNSATYYVEPKITLQMNSKCAGFTPTYEIVYGNTKEWVFKYSLWGVIPSNRAVADATFNAYALTYDSTFSIPAAGKPANQTGEGTAANTTFLPFYATFSAALKGVAMYRIDITVNTTDTTQFAIQSVNIPGVGFKAGGDFSANTQTAQIIYTYYFSGSQNNDLSTCTWWELPSNTNNKIDLTTSVKFTMASGNGAISFDMKLSGYDATGAGISTHSICMVTE